MIFRFCTFEYLRQFCAYIKKDEYRQFVRYKTCGLRRRVVITDVKSISC